MEKHKQIHWDDILRYLKGTIGICVAYKRGQNLNIISYSNVDLACSHFDRRPTARYCTLLEKIS